MAARLDGSLDFLEMETFKNPVLSPPPLSPHSGQHQRGWYVCAHVSSNSDCTVHLKLEQTFLVLSCLLPQVPCGVKWVNKILGGDQQFATSKGVLKVFVNPSVSCLDGLSLCLLLLSLWMKCCCTLYRVAVYVFSLLPVVLGQWTSRCLTDILVSHFWYDLLPWQKFLSSTSLEFCSFLQL